MSRKDENCVCGFSAPRSDWIFRPDVDIPCWDPLCTHAGYECPECGRLYDQVRWTLAEEPDQGASK